MSSKKVISLFSGIGGLDLGFVWAGYKIVWACDNEKVAVDSYNLNFDEKSHHADLTDWPINKIPKGDVIIGGPPCQSFSLVGKRKKNDPRGKLVFKFYEIIREKQPKAFVMENVPGMAASRIDGERVPDILSNKFQKLGYSVSFIKLNAIDYLVPQKRKRIVIVGVKGSHFEMISPELYSKQFYGVDITQYDCSAKAAIGDLGPCVEKGKMANYIDKELSIFARIMRKENGKVVSLHERPRMSETDIMLVKNIPPGGNYKDVPDNIATGRILKFKKTGGRTTTYGRLHSKNPSYTINTYFRRPNVGCNFHYAEDRLITVREAMRFQSIPDHFQIQKAAQDKRNALIGNAVPPLLAHAIALSLKKTLSQ